MKRTTPSRILEFLLRNRTATASELGRALGLTGADIRHHLVKMQAGNQLVVVSQRLEGRGRPTKVYGPSTQGLGNGLGTLSEAVLSAWLDHLRADDRDAALLSIAERLGDKNSFGSLTSMPRKLALVVDRLNALHYHARWEASPTGARLTLDNCPYSEIIEGHPELCRLDAHLLQTLSGMPARQLAKLERSQEGLPRCIFALG